MRGFVYMASRDKVDVDTFHKGIQYALERLGKSKFGFESTTVSNFKSKSHEGSGNELVDYSRAPCLGADQKARGLWERDWHFSVRAWPPTELQNNCACVTYDPVGATVGAVVGARRRENLDLSNTFLMNCNERSIKER